MYEIYVRRGAALYSDGPLLGRSVIPKVLYSEGPIFRRSFIPKVFYPEGPLFRKSCSLKDRYYEELRSRHPRCYSAMSVIFS